MIDARPLSSVLLPAALQERQEAVARVTAKAVDLERQLRSAHRQFAEATAIASQAAEVYWVFYSSHCARKSNSGSQGSRTHALRIM